MPRSMKNAASATSGSERTRETASFAIAFLFTTVSRGERLDIDRELQRVERQGAPNDNRCTAQQNERKPDLRDDHNPVLFSTLFVRARSGAGLEQIVWIDA